MVRFVIASSLAYGNLIEPSRTLLLTILYKDKPYAEGFENIWYEDSLTKKETVYRRNGADIQRETCEYDPKTLFPKSYTIRNFETGQEIDLSPDGSDRVKIRHLPKTGAKEETKSMEWRDSMTLAKSIHEVLLANWVKVTTGGGTSFPILVPYKFDYFTFRYRRESSLDDKTYRFRLEADNFFVRQFIGEPIFLDYSDDRHIIRYQGPTTFPIEGNETARVEIRFEIKAPSPLGLPSNSLDTKTTVK